MRSASAVYYTFTRTTVNLGPVYRTQPCLRQSWQCRPWRAEPASVELEGEEPQRAGSRGSARVRTLRGCTRLTAGAVHWGSEHRATQALGTAWQRVTHSAQPYVFHCSSRSHSAFLEEPGQRRATKRYFPSPSSYSQCQLHRLTLSRPETEEQASVRLHASTPKEEQIHSSPEFTAPCPAHCPRGNGGSLLAFPEQQGSLQNLALILGRRWRSALGKWG